MFFSRRAQNTPNGHPLHPVDAQGFVGGALENDVPVTRPIAVAVAIAGLIFILFLGCSLWAIFAKKKGAVQRRQPLNLDLEESSVKDNDSEDLQLQAAFVKSCFDTYPRRAGLSFPQLGFSDPGGDTPTSISHLRFSHLSSLPDTITMPPPAYSSRTHSLISSKPPSISFLQQTPPSISLTRPKNTRRRFFTSTKANEPLPLPPPVISSPIPLPEPPLPGPPIEHEYSPKPIIYLIPELTPMSPLQLSVTRLDRPPDASAVSRAVVQGPRLKTEQITTYGDSTCPCACHVPPSSCSNCRKPRPRPIYIPASSSLYSDSTSSDSSSLASSQIGLAF